MVAPDFEPSIGRAHPLGECEPGRSKTASTLSERLYSPSDHVPEVLKGWFGRFLGNVSWKLKIVLVRSQGRAGNEGLTLLREGRPNFPHSRPVGLQEPLFRIAAGLGCHALSVPLRRVLPASEMPNASTTVLLGRSEPRIVRSDSSFELVASWDV